MSGWLVQAARDRGSSPEDNTDRETLLVDLQRGNIGYFKH